MNRIIAVFMIVCLVAGTAASALAADSFVRDPETEAPESIPETVTDSEAELAGSFSELYYCVKLDDHTAAVGCYSDIEAILFVARYDGTGKMLCCFAEEIPAADALRELTVTLDAAAGDNTVTKAVLLNRKTGRPVCSERVMGDGSGETGDFIVTGGSAGLD